MWRTSSAYWFTMELLGTEFVLGTWRYSQLLQKFRCWLEPRGTLPCQKDQLLLPISKHPYRTAPIFLNILWKVYRGCSRICPPSCMFSACPARLVLLDSSTCHITEVLQWYTLSNVRLQVYS